LVLHIYIDNLLYHFFALFQVICAFLAKWRFDIVKKSKKIIISAAITGAIHTPTMSPYFPASPEQIAQQAIDAARAGAAVVHIHARRSDGMPVGDFETFRQILTTIKKESNAVIGITTGGANGMSTEERFSVIEEFQPEMASANGGSMNFCYHKLATQLKEPLHDWESSLCDPHI
jgi:uncharacterized protein (DUF849 family)